MIGKRGEDPRHLLRRQYLNKKGSKKPTDKDRRDQVSHVRRAMEVWLEYKAYQRGEEGAKVIELEKLQAAAETAELPPVWGADRVRQFHNERVS
jgi:hypothetical protein